MNRVCPAVKHSLDYYYTASSGVTKFPDFIGTLVLDGSLAVYCDSNKQTVEAKQDWMKRFFDDNPKHLDLYTGQCVAEIDYFKATIETLKERFNQTGGMYCVRFHFLLLLCIRAVMSPSR